MSCNHYLFIYLFIYFCICWWIDIYLVFIYLFIFFQTLCVNHHLSNIFITVLCQTILVLKLRMKASDVFISFFLINYFHSYFCSPMPYACTMYALRLDTSISSHVFEFISMRLIFKFSFCLSFPYTLSFSYIYLMKINCHEPPWPWEACTCIFLICHVYVWSERIKYLFCSAQKLPPPPPRPPLLPQPPVNMAEIYRSLTTTSHAF